MTFPGLTDRRARLMLATLGFLRFDSQLSPVLPALHRWLDSWRGIGDIVTGMKQHGYEVSLGDHGSSQWIAVFYEGHGGDKPLEAAGTAQAPTPWSAVQRAAWEALNKTQQTG